MVPRASVLTALRLLIFPLLVATATRADEGDWIGRDFVPGPNCRPMIGSQEFPLSRLPTPFQVQKVHGNWLWTGQVWVKKQDVIAVEPIVEFDVARNGDYLLIPVTIAGREYSFVVDTGTTCTIVDSALEPFLEKAEAGRVEETGQPINVYHLGGAFVRKSTLPVTGPVLCFDLGPFRRNSGLDCRGILGMTFLMERVIRVDFDSGKLAILRPFPRRRGGAFSRSYDRNTFRLGYDEAQLPILDVQIAGNVPDSFFLDTGAAYSECGEIGPARFRQLVKSGHLIDTETRRSHLTMGGVKTGHHAQVKLMRLGDFEHTALSLTEGDCGLGLGYLSRFVITFDFPNGLLHLKKGRRFDEPERSSKSGMRLIRIGTDTIITFVTRSGPADLAGLCRGERILRVNGHDCANNSLFELRNKLSEDGRLARLVVQGDGEPREVVLLLGDWWVKRKDASDVDPQASTTSVQPAGGDDASPGAVEKLLRKAEMSSRENDFTTAIAYYTECIQNEASSPVAYFGRGDAWGSLGEHDLEIADYTQVITLDPRNAAAYHRRAYVRAQKGEDQMAITDYDESIKLDPTDALAFYNRGNAWLRLGENDKAIADYAESIRLDPDDGAAFRNRSQALINKGEYEAALNDYATFKKLRQARALKASN